MQTDPRVLRSDSNGGETDDKKSQSVNRAMGSDEKNKEDGNSEWSLDFSVKRKLRNICCFIVFLF